MGENTFKVGDYVEVITKRSEDFGLKGYIQRIEGHMYKVANSYWYVWQELDYAEAPADEAAQRGNDADAGDAEHELAVAKYVISTLEGQLEYLGNQVKESEAELATALEHEASESVTLAMEIAEALGLDRHAFLDADGPDAIVEAIETLRKERNAAVAALEAIADDLPYKKVWYDYCKARGIEPLVLTKEQVEHGLGSWELAYQEIARRALQAAKQAPSATGDQAAK